MNGQELYDLQEDPGESLDISATDPTRVAMMRADYEAWFKDVANTRGFEPPLIDLGTAFENPVLLTRQDWRGPQASWSDDGLGFWDVDVKTNGTCECSLLFPAIPNAGTAWVSIAGIKKEISISLGATAAIVLLEGIKHGETTVKAALLSEDKPPRGPHYVRVRHVLSHGKEMHL